MKCPYCGFVSFEYLNGCKKCSKDLSAHKSQFGIEYLEPVSLEMYAYAGGGAAVGAVTSASEDDGDGFGTDDFAVDNESDSASLGAVEVAEDEADHLNFGDDGADDISIDFDGGDEGTEEVSIDIGGDADDELSIDLGESDSVEDVSLDLGEAEDDDEISLDLGEAEPEEEISLDLGEAEDDDEISLDLGEAEPEEEISLDLGEAEADDEISLDLGEAEPEEEISLDFSTDSADEISLDIAEDDSPAVAEEDEGVELDFGDELGSDSGFSLDLGEELSDDTNAAAIDDEITLDFDDEPAVAEPNATTPAEEDSIEIALDDVDMGDPDQTVAINRGDVEEIGDEAAPAAADDDFADIELSVEDEDLFGGEEDKGEAPLLDDEEDELGLDTNLDLGDLSLEIGDDELGFDFDDTDAKLG